MFLTFLTTERFYILICLILVTVLFLLEPKMFVVQKKGNTARRVQSGVTAAVTDSRKQTTVLLSKHTNKYSLHCRRKSGRGTDPVARNARKKGTEQHPIPIKKTVSHKQLLLISSTP